MYDMRHSLTVRRIFEERARLVVYVESADADKMEKLARGEGKTLVEWMRETLLGELEQIRGGENQAYGLRNGSRIRVAGRSASARGGINPVDSGMESGQGVPEDGASKRTARQRGTSGVSGEPGAGMQAERRGGNLPKERDMAAHASAENPITRSPKTCKHGVSKGWRCWQCGGVAIIDA